MKYYEMRLESIGGLGANLAGKILGELGALYLDKNSASFSSYGSEKRGSPVKAYIRWCDNDQRIYINSPVKKPDILGIFHENLAGKAGIMAGADENTSIIVNTPSSPEEIRKKFKMYRGTLYCIDALKIAAECKTRVNMVMLGAIVRATGFVPLKQLENAVSDTLGKKYPKALPSNIEGIRKGYENAKPYIIPNDDLYEYEEYKDIKYDWGWDNAPIGGVNPNFGNMVSNDLSASREGYVPVFNKEKCINCGLCESTCPDYVYQFVKGEYKGKSAMVNLGADYHHCKGCMRCVEICPTNALTEALEKDVDISKMHVRNQQLIVDKLEFEHTGANSYMRSESWTTNTTL